MCMHWLCGVRQKLSKFLDTLLNSKMGTKATVLVHAVKDQDQLWRVSGPGMDQEHVNS